MGIERERARELVRKELLAACDALRELEVEAARASRIVRAAMSTLESGATAGAIGMCGGADLDMVASRAARRCERSMLALTIAYEAEGQ